MALQREFASREELVRYVSAAFPEAAAEDAHVARVKGGRSEALVLLEQIRPERYSFDRNFLDGSVTTLAPSEFPTESRTEDDQSSRFWSGVDADEFCGT